MEKSTVFIDYQKLLDEISVKNRSRETGYDYIKNGTVHTTLAICKIYGQFIQNNFRPDPLRYHNSRTEIYLSASAIAGRTGYHPRTIKDHIAHIRMTNILEIYNVYQSTYKITVPLRFFFKAQSIEYLNQEQNKNNS